MNTPLTPPADDKDWTWVLERPCPECGLDTRVLTPASIHTVILATADAWSTRLAEPGVRDRPWPERWSPLEYGCHVRDVYRVADERIGLMLHLDGPDFANWDQDATAVAERYDLQDPGPVAIGVRAAATRVAVVLSGLGPAAWSRPGRRGDGAAFTVESFARYLVHDPAHHLHDVGALDLPALLAP